MTNQPHILDQPLNTNADPGQAEKLLEGIQANILKFHARLHAEVLFVSFTASADKARKGIAEIAKTLTSAKDQRDQTRRWKEDLSAESDGRRKTSDSGPLRMMALAWRGYEHLGLVEFAPKPRVEQRRGQKSSYFSEGMQKPHVSYYGELWDPHVNQWEGSYKDPALPIHLMVLQADDDEDRLRNHVAEAQIAIDTFGVVVAHETLRRKIHEEVDTGHPIEHFGFRDGISKPLFVTTEEQKPGTQFIDKSPEEPLGKVLVPEPGYIGHQPDASQNPVAAEERYGSFLVVLKLEQNVRRFLEQTRGLADRLRITHEQAQELCVGRRKNGQPLISHVDVSEKHGESPATLEPVLVTSEDDFNFTDDGQGLRCPFHAHIRKVNPRYDGEKNLRFRPVLARRGMPYGKERKDLGPSGVGSTPSEAVGLMFMSFQAEICDFVRAMSRAQEPDTRAGIDPILGRVPARLGITDQYDQTWTTLEWDEVGGNLGGQAPSFREIKFRVSDLVTPKGGEYFFTPSVPFLKGLDKLPLDKRNQSGLRAVAGSGIPQPAQQLPKPPRRQGRRRGRL